MSAGSHTHGLTNAEARQRLARHGPNALPAQEKLPAWKRLGAQFKSPLIYVLLAALIVDLAVWWIDGGHGFPIESLAIGVILLLNASLGVWQERKAEAALSHLKTLSAPLAWVRRDGAWHHIAAAHIVPGDIARVESGDRVPADGLLRGAEVAVDESMLTGESVPVTRTDGDLLSSGTIVVRGKALLEVTATGGASALGRLAAMLGGIESEQTPLERRIRHFGNQVAIWISALAVALVVGGVAVEGLGSIGHVFLFAVALAVAAVPEGLPAVMTLTLTLGVERMARRRAVVRKLAAVEALGSVTVIATDKTGTITENQMHVRSVDSPSRALAVRAMILANDAQESAGDPIDVALLRFAREEGIDVNSVLASCPRISARPFDSRHKYMRATVQEEAGVVSYLKGAPEVLLQRSTMDEPGRRHWSEKAGRYARDGYRVLGVAWGAGTREDDLEFLGLVLMWDPPRGEVPDSIRRALDAGVRVIMVTGDHPETARSIARQVGIPGDRVLTGDDMAGMSADALVQALREVTIFARVHPEHKVRIVESLQSSGEIVAVTGDGLNDAPALKRADVGVAMGVRGSDIARDVADLVLMDDNFATIVAAIEEGRSIYENIRKFIRFLFSTNLSEVIVVSLGWFLAAVLGLHETTGAVLLPLTAVQILWINLATDGLPALALTLDRNPGVMRRPPLPPVAPLLDTASRRFVLVSGSAKAMVALSILGVIPLLGMSVDTARTVSFHFLCIGQLFFAYPARHTWLKPRPNPTLHAAIVFGIAVQVMVGTLPAAARALGAVPMTWPLWTTVIGCALATWGMAELVSRWQWRQPGNPGLTASPPRTDDRRHP
jgi:Ca2+-transporting ATPase